VKRERKVRVQLTLSGLPLQHAEALFNTGLWGTTLAKTVRELCFRTLRHELSDGLLQPEILRTLKRRRR